MTKEENYSVCRGQAPGPPPQGTQDSDLLPCFLAQALRTRAPLLVQPLAAVLAAPSPRPRKDGSAQLPCSQLRHPFLLHLLFPIPAFLPGPIYF